MARDLSCGQLEIYLELEMRRVACPKCGGVKRECLDWLADNPFYTKRFAFYVGRRCRDCSIKAVAEELRLDWKTVKELDKQYMREQVRRMGRPTPWVIGIDEVSIRKGHTYRIVVSDLLRRRPIWFGGQDRSEASMDEFYTWLGPKKCGGIRLAVMDMWKPFRTATARHAPDAAILFDKFHIMRHLGEAQSFGQLWSYQREGWARRFFQNWKSALKWQRLKPYEKFARMIETHWEGIAAFCRPENKVSLGFVEGLNNKIRVIQRRAYGLRDEEYLRLKVLTCMLPPI